MLQTVRNQNLPSRGLRASGPCEVTQAEIALCRTRPALSLLLHLRTNYPSGLAPIVCETIGQEMAPCRLSHNTVRDALARLIEADLVEVIEACPIPRNPKGRPITRLYSVKPFGSNP